ncbi:BLUF domain-containing protein [Methylobacterium sp. J-076]|uniref:BLUF domain-containing protein n=1 Tax=Methylobacterium sp. J-076 TaxID=2836655 RepID=UPI001FBADE1C|nr:BLUF domain-containing protein [Methylobacterium sp. J-076]MCJ2011802.1 BLUF domain-containing protein [Methylobacterium sp. J-076]
MIDLYRLIYVSKNMLDGGESEIANAVTQILEASKRNNSKVNVTGALMFNTGAFAQVLEGPRQAVEETFERIQCDIRHGDVTVLQCGPTESRSFANWSMAFVGQSSAGRAQFSQLAAESGFDLSKLDGEAVFGMLHGLVLEEERMPVPAFRGPIDKASAVTGLDVDQVRTEIAQLRPDGVGSRVAPMADEQRVALIENAGQRPSLASDMTHTSQTAIEAALRTLKAALASERQRTSELRTEIDTLQVSLALSDDQVAIVRRERDRWAERARFLALAISQEVGAAQMASQDLGLSGPQSTEQRRSEQLGDTIAA